MEISLQANSINNVRNFSSNYYHYIFSKYSLITFFVSLFTAYNFMSFNKISFNYNNEYVQNLSNLNDYLYSKENLNKLRNLDEFMFYSDEDYFYFINEKTVEEDYKGNI